MPGMAAAEEESVALPPIGGVSGTPRSNVSGAASVVDGDRSRPGSVDRPESEPLSREETVGFGVGNADDAASMAHTMRTEATERSMGTKKRLDQVMDTFKSFDTDMKVGTRQRREKDEFKIYKMKQQLAGLESTLHAEVKYRQEMNKSVKNWMSDEVNALQAHCDDLRDDQQLRIQRRIDKVADRITDMEQRFAKDMAEIPVQIEERGAALAAMLKITVAAIEEERASRVAREEAITKKLADHEAYVAGEFKDHRNGREDALDDLQSALENHIRQHMKFDEKCKAAFREEIASLKNSVVLESQERERHDLELAAALKRYITKLQSSLHIVNSTATE